MLELAGGHIVAGVENVVDAEDAARQDALDSSRQGAVVEGTLWSCWCSIERTDTARCAEQSEGNGQAVSAVAVSIPPKWIFEWNTSLMEVELPALHSYGSEQPLTPSIPCLAGTRNPVPLVQQLVPKQAAVAREGPLGCGVERQG